MRKRRIWGPCITPPEQVVTSTVQGGRWDSTEMGASPGGRFSTDTLPSIFTLDLGKTKVVWLQKIHSSSVLITNPFHILKYN